MVSSQSRRQDAVSHSTPETDLAAADNARRTEGSPALPMWEHLLGRQAGLNFMEENQAVGNISEAGGSANLTHVPQIHMFDARAVVEHL